MQELLDLRAQMVRYSNQTLFAAEVQAADKGLTQEEASSLQIVTPQLPEYSAACHELQAWSFLTLHLEKRDPREEYSA